MSDKGSEQETRHQAQGEGEIPENNRQRPTLTIKGENVKVERAQAMPMPRPQNILITEGPNVVNNWEPKVTDLRNTLSQNHLCIVFKEYLRGMHVMGSETLFTCNLMVTYVEMMVAIRELLSLPMSTPAEVRRCRALAIFCDAPIYPAMAAMGAPPGGVTIHNLQLHLISLRMHVIPAPDEGLMAQVYNDLERILIPKHEQWKQYVMVLYNYVRRLA